MTVPDWKIERYLLGELPEAEMQALKNLENDELRLQIEQLKNSNEELLAKYPYKRKFKVLSNVPLRLAAIFLLCASALVAVLSNEDIYEEGTRVKGMKTDLEIWRKTGDSAEKLANYSEAKAGDLLQMRYIAEKKCYGAILSVDGNGTLTIHLSGKNGKAIELEAGKTVSLEKGYELDNAPKYETFYLFTAEKEFELSPVAENLLQGKLPKNLQVAQITLKKK